MKKIHLLTALALLSTGIFAFNRQHSEKAATQQELWHLVAGGDPADPADYDRGDSPFECGGESIVCTILAVDNGNDQPDLSSGSPATNPTAYSATFRDE